MDKMSYTLVHRMTSLQSVCSLPCFCCEESTREPSLKSVNLQLEENKGQNHTDTVLVISNCFGSSLLDPIWPLENLSRIRQSFPSIRDNVVCLCSKATLPLLAFGLDAVEIANLKCRGCLHHSAPCDFIGRVPQW